MFKVLEKVEFNRVVTVVIPVDGGTEKLKIPTRFRLLSDDQLAEIKIDSTSSTKDFLRKIIVNFHDLKDGDEDVPFNDRVLESLLKWAPVRTGLVTAYRKALEEGYEGN